jgi:hypothetical protein
MKVVSYGAANLFGRVKAVSKLKSIINFTSIVLQGFISVKTRLKSFLIEPCVAVVMAPFESIQAVNEPLANSPAYAIGLLNNPVVTGAVMCCGGIAASPVPIPPPSTLALRGSMRVMAKKKAPPHVVSSLTGLSGSVKSATTVSGVLSTAPPPTGFLAPLEFINQSAVTTWTAPKISFAHTFADGDVPVGGSITAKDSNNNSVTVQIDAISSWPSGHMACAVLTIATTETYAPGDVFAYNLYSSATPPVNTNSWSVPDIRVQYSGGDCGSSTYTVKVQDIFSNFTNYPWGTSFPQGGWRVVKSGANCKEWWFWQYLTNDSVGGKTQGYVRCDILVKALGASGPYEVKVRTIMPNIWNTIATDSELYNGYPNRFAADVTVLLGSTPQAYMGGVNDPRAVPVTFDHTTQIVTFGGSSPIGETAVIFSSTGALPTGLAVGTLYWLSGGQIWTQRQYMSDYEQGVAYPNYVSSNSYGTFARCTNPSTGQKYFSTSSGTSGTTAPTGATFADGTLLWERVNPVFTDNGSGVITAAPMYAAYQQGGWEGRDINGNPLWVGSGSFPQVVPGHDLDYLFSSKATLPFNKAAIVQTTDMSPPQYGPNQVFGGLWWYQDTTGDSNGDQRIGHMDNWGLVSLYNPQDPFYFQSSLCAALNWSQYPQNFFYDERNGLPFTADNGPNNSGLAYTNYPTPLPGWLQNGVPGNGSARAPGPPGNTWVAWASNITGVQGGLGSGQYWNDLSHTPCPAQTAYLKTGCPFMEDQMVGYANSSSALAYYSYVNYNGTATYSAINAGNGSQQLRAWGWALRNIQQALYFCSDSHPHKPVLQNIYKSHYNYQAFQTTTLPSQAAVFGNLYYNALGDGRYPPWSFHFLDMAVSLDYWRGGLVSGTMTDITTLFNYMANHYAAYSTGTFVYYLGTYYYHFQSTPGDWTSCYTDSNTMFTANYPPGNTLNCVTPPAPANMVDDPNNNTAPHQFNSPQFTTAYAVIAQTALKTRNVANPSDGTVAACLASIKTAISAQTGVSSTQGGISWSFTYAGKIQNYHCFTCF